MRLGGETLRLLLGGMERCLPIAILVASLLFPCCRSRHVRARPAGCTATSLVCAPPSLLL